MRAATRFINSLDRLFRCKRPMSRYNHLIGNDRAVTSHCYPAAIIFKSRLGIETIASETCHLNIKLSLYLMFETLRNEIDRLYFL